MVCIFFHISLYASAMFTSTTVELKAPELGVTLTPFDLKRLESYANNMLDYHVILDLMPTVANLYFQKRLGAVSGAVNAQASEGPVRLTAVQSSILLAIGLQRKTLEDLEVSPTVYCFVLRRYILTL